MMLCVRRKETTNHTNHTNFLSESASFVRVVRVVRGKNSYCIDSLHNMSYK
jgi:hypothetical protein